MSSVQGPSGGPPLESFRLGARDSENLQVTLDGQQFRVVAQGSMDGRNVSWVQGDVDTTTMFVRALGEAMGDGIAAAVARELSLDPSPGRPLSSRTVEQALDMAETGRQAMAGVDFVEKLREQLKAGAGERDPK